MHCLSIYVYTKISMSPGLTNFLLDLLKGRQAASDEDDVHLLAGQLVDVGATDAAGATRYNWNQNG